MKIKHWQGYGTVNAMKIHDSNTLHVKVVGNHEWGIYRNDEYDLYYWLVKRFDKKENDYVSWSKKCPKIDIYQNYICVDGSYTESCDYIFNY